MKITPNPSTGGFIWPSLPLLFSLLFSAIFITLLIYGLLLIVEF